MAVRKQKTNSIRFKLLAGVIGLLAPLIILLLVYNYNAMNIVIRQVTASKQSILDQYMMQFDTRLGVIGSYIRSVSVSNSNIITLENKTTIHNAMIATNNLSIKMSHDILAFNQLDYLFVYNPDKNVFVYDYRKDASDYSDRIHVKAYIMDLIADKGINEQFTYSGIWNPVMVDNEAYIIYLTKSEQTYVGAWIKLENVLAPLLDIDLGREGSILFQDSSGLRLTGSVSIPDDIIISSDEINYLVPKYSKFVSIESLSDRGPFSLIALISERTILDNLPYYQTIILIATAISILLIPISVYFIRRIVIKPIDRTISAMNKVMKGNIDVRIESERTSDEFLVLNDVFNNMLDQIYELRANVYEEQLEKKQAELEHLQLQIRPHFFLNSLNIIYRLAQKQQFGLIQDMSKCLISHFQYIFHNNSQFVKLGEELKHVKNLMRIQGMRYYGRFEFSIESQDFLRDIPIPPLLIQSFVENAMKYAVSLDEPIRIRVGVDFIELEGRQFIEITISDNGCGFPKAYLGKASSEKISKDPNWKHIGIWNAFRRLQLIYIDQAQLILENATPRGAVVTIRLPIRSPRNDQDLIRAKDQH